MSNITRDVDGPLLDLNCADALFALLMMLGQMQLTARGVEPASLIDIADASTYTQIALAE